jgi:hypothetical protein
MALQIAFRYESLDSTALLNQRLKSLVTAGVYTGGLFTSFNGTLSPVRSSFAATTLDGVTVWDDQTAAITFVAGQTNVHVVLAKYNAGGSPSSPVLQEQVLEESVYNAHVDKAYMIVLSKVTLAGGATEVTASDVDYTTRDEVDPVSRKLLRGVVATTGLLPTGSTGEDRRTGDLWLVLADGGSLYHWTGVAWAQLVSKGSATLDGAYDNNGVDPGAGRVITADAGAVEIQQSTTVMYGKDGANAALRVRTDSSSLSGSNAIDVVAPAQNSSAILAQNAALLVRENIADGFAVTTDEDVNIVAGSSNQLQFPTAFLHNYTFGGNGALIHLIEITGSTLGQNNLYICEVTSVNTATVKDLNGNTVVTAAETGLTCNLYTVRSSIGGGYNNYLNDMLGGVDSVSSYLLLGSIERSSVADHRGLILAYTENSLDQIFGIYQLNSAGTLSETLSVTPESIATSGTIQALSDGVAGAGARGFEAVITSSGTIGVYAEMSGSSTSAIYGKSTYNGLPANYAVRGEALYSNHGVYGQSVDGRAVYGLSSGSGDAIYGVATGTGNGVYGQAAGVGAAGVLGLATGGGYGVYGQAAGASAAVQGNHTGAAEGVYGTSVSGAGVLGQATSGPGVSGISSTGIGVQGSSFGFNSNKSIHVQLPLTGFLGESDWTWEPQALRWASNVSVALNNMLAGYFDILPHNAVITGILINWEADGTGHSVSVVKYTTPGVVAAADGGTQTPTSLGTANFSNGGGSNNSALQFLDLTGASEANRTFDKGTDLLAIRITSNNSGSYFRVFGCQVNFTFREHGLNYPPSV